jgi:hypothetical protein
MFVCVHAHYDTNTKSIIFHAATALQRAIMSGVRDECQQQRDDSFLQRLNPVS